MLAGMDKLRDSGELPCWWERKDRRKYDSVLWVFRVSVARDEKEAAKNGKNTEESSGAEGAVPEATSQDGSEAVSRPSFVASSDVRGKGSSFYATRAFIRPPATAGYCY